MAYYEVSARYARMTDTAGLGRVVGAIVGPSGMRSTDPQLRSRAAYLFLKITESLSLDGKASMLLPCVGTLGIFILHLLLQLLSVE